MRTILPTGTIEVTCGRIYAITKARLYPRSAITEKIAVSSDFKAYQEQQKFMG